VSRIESFALVVVLTALAALAACASQSGSGSLVDDVATDESGASDVNVQIVSHNPRDVVIYIFLGTSRQRLGLAGGNSTTNFRLPWHQVQGASVAHLLAEQMGDSDRVESDLLQLKPGGRVVWTVEADLSRSIDATF